MDQRRSEPNPNTAIRTSRVRDLSRRQLLGIVGGSVATALAAGNRRLFGAVERMRTSRPTLLPRSVDEHIAQACVVTPEQTEGPYFVDERLNRSDIRSDPANGNVKEGVPLRLTVNVLRTDRNACAPLAGAVVDVWQCDALGVYSDVTDPRFSTVGQKFLRGYQVTDAAGAARFLTVYPGWYEGRTVHIHFKIRTDPKASRGYDFTSQLYFDDALSDVVYARPPYAARGTRTARNADDRIFRSGGSQLLLAPEGSGEGYTATFGIGLQTS